MNLNIHTDSDLKTLKIGKAYALTLAGSNKAQFQNLSFVDRYKKCRNLHCKLLSEFQINEISYYFVEELSIPKDSNISRYHLHGYIVFQSEDAILYFLLEFLSGIADRFQWKLKEVTDRQGWFDYCHKQNLLGSIHNLAETPSAGEGELRLSSLLLSTPTTMYTSVERNPKDFLETAISVKTRRRSKKQ